MDLYLKNNADTSISSNPASWKLIINGLQHDEDSATFDASIGNQAVNVLKGGELKTNIVYSVKGYPTTGYLKYDRSYGPTLQRVNYSFT